MDRVEIFQRILNIALPGASLANTDWILGSINVYIYQRGKSTAIGGRRSRFSVSLPLPTSRAAFSESFTSSDIACLYCL